MPPLPAFVLACPATVTLILRALAGELPRGYYEAWEALENPEDYEPTEEVRLWVHEHWREMVPADAPAKHLVPTVPALLQTPVLSEPWMAPFLDEYAKSKNITQSAKAGPVDRGTVRVYRKHDPEFARAFELAHEAYRDLIRSTIKERAIDGWDEPVFGRIGKDQDGIVGHIRKHDNRVLLRHAETELEEYAATRAGQKVEVHATANANASAQATALSAPPELLDKLRQESRLQMQKKLARAARKKLGGPPETSKSLTP